MRRPPFWLMRQAGRYLPEYRALRRQAGSFLELCYSPELAAEATLQPVKRFAMDAAILFSDILVVLDGLGARVGFHEGEGPRVEPVREIGGLSGLSIDGVVEHLSPVYETVARVRDGLPRDVTLIGFAGAPWTVATYLVEGGASKDFRWVKSWAFGDPEGFGQLVDMVMRATVAHLVAQAREGAEVLQIFDSWAGVLPPRAFDRWCIAPTCEIVRGVKAEFPEIPVIGFPRGVGPMIGRYAERTGVDAVGLDSGVALNWAVSLLGDEIVVQGNLDPVMLLVGGDVMVEAIKEGLATMQGRPYVFNLGHGVLTKTPVENVARLAETIRNWNG